VRKGGGKGKGSGFEREICKALSLWATKGMRDDVFWRSSLSGGRATVGRKTGKEMAHVAGDLCAVRPEGYAFAAKWFMELKSYKDLQVERFILEHRGTLWDFWQKARKEAVSHKKLPLMFLHQNQLKTFVLIDLLDCVEFENSMILAQVPAGDHIACFLSYDDLIKYERLKGKPKVRRAE
jgi:hypothetical protein